MTQNGTENVPKASLEVDFWGTDQYGQSVCNKQVLIIQAASPCMRPFSGQNGSAFDWAPMDPLKGPHIDLLVIHP